MRSRRWRRRRSCVTERAGEAAGVTLTALVTLAGVGVAVSGTVLEMLQRAGMSPAGAVDAIVAVLAALLLPAGVVVLLIARASRPGQRALRCVSVPSPGSAAALSTPAPGPGVAGVDGYRRARRLIGVGVVVADGIAEIAHADRAGADIAGQHSRRVSQDGPILRDTLAVLWAPQ